MTTLPIFEGIRLTVWGVGILLMWLALGRVRDWITLRTLKPGEAAIALPLTKDVAHDALLLGTMALLAFSVAILQNYIAYLGAGRIPLVSAASLWLLFWLQCRFLSRIAYHPRYMVRWALCWGIFAHLVTFMPVVL